MYRRMLVEEPLQLENLFTDRFLSSNCDAPPRFTQGFVLDVSVNLHTRIIMYWYNEQTLLTLLLSKKFTVISNFTLK